jgi:hypothetical protein
MLPDPLPQLQQRIRTRKLETRMPRALDLVGSEGDVDLLAAGGDVKPGLSAHMTYPAMKSGGANGWFGY